MDPQPGTRPNYESQAETLASTIPGSLYATAHRAATATSGINDILSVSRSTFYAEVGRRKVKSVSHTRFQCITWQR